MNKSKNISKYTTLLSLYLAQSIPMTFFSTVMPIIMRLENFSLTAIGLLQLIKLPWILKFLWAPLIDKSGDTVTNYKKWIFVSEMFYAAVILITALLDFHTDFKLIVFLLLIAFTASATQDIATDAFAYLILKKDERSLGNSMQSAGSFLGTVTGSGILLIIYHYFGWRYLLVALSGFVLLALLPLVGFKTQSKSVAKQNDKVGWNEILWFFKRPYMGKRVLFLLLFYAGLIGILTMLKPWLVDLGYNTKQIGLMSGIYGPAFGAISAVATGFFIKKYHKHIVLKLILFLVLLSGVYFLWLSQNTGEYYQYLLAVLSVWGVYGMASVFIYTTAMDWVRKGRAGTDFTLQIVLTHIGSLLLAVMSGKLAHNLGYEGLYVLEVLLSTLLLVLLPYLYKEFPEIKTRYTDN